MIYTLGRQDQDPWWDLASKCTETTDDLRPYKGDFDAIACCGVSGIGIATAVALRLRKRLIVVRKKDDVSTHSAWRVEGRCEGRYIFLDDFVGSGQTIRFVQAQIAANTLANKHCEIVGAYTYLDRSCSKWSGQRPYGLS